MISAIRNCRPGDALRIGAVAALLAVAAPVSARAQVDGRPLYLWSERLVLHAAPSFSAAAEGELAYGEAVKLLAAPGPLERGGGVYPPLRPSDEDAWYQRKTHPPRHPFFRHGRWLKLRSLAAPLREGYAFDSELLPLPAPRCDRKAIPCDLASTMGGGECSGGARNCESVEAYSARTFGLLSQNGKGVSRAATGEIIDERNAYGQGVKVVYSSAADGLIQLKRWTLPMLRSLDQAYVVMRRFFGDCRWLDSYDPAREIVFGSCGGMSGASAILKRETDGIVIDWGYLD
jgi:hypothetical protein